MPGSMLARRDVEWLARAVAIILGLIVLLGGAGRAVAASPDEDYPPDAIVNLVDPFVCDATSVSGEIGVVEANSVVNIRVILVEETSGIVRQALPDGDVLGQLSARANADGQLRYTVPIETGRYGSVVVVATGTDSIGNPFTLQTSGELVTCPSDLPSTGNSGSGMILQIAAVVIVAGVILVAAARRRHIRATG
jgi:hypothetical protein